MALWKYSTSNDKWKNCSGYWHRSLPGPDAYLLCPGPSLATVSAGTLNQPGVFLAAINTAWPTLTPHLWIGMDTPDFFDPQLFHQPFPKVCRGGYQDTPWQGKKLKEFPETYFADCDEAAASQLFLRQHPDSTMVFNHSTFVFSLHFLTWLGARRIHLVGADFRAAPDKDYCDGRRLDEPGRAVMNRMHKKLLGLMPMLRRRGETHGIQFISCTAGSAANEHFEYVPLQDAIAATTARVADAAA